MYTNNSFVATEEQIQCDRIKCSLTRAMRKNRSNYRSFAIFYGAKIYTTIGIPSIS